MQTPSRRQYLAALGSGATVALAGCGGAEPHFLVTHVQIIHNSGITEGTYPDDIVVQVELENDYPNPQEADLETTLSYAPDGATSPETTWTERKEAVEVMTGQAAPVNILFEDAYESGRNVSEEYEADAELLNHES